MEIHGLAVGGDGNAYPIVVEVLIDVLVVVGHSLKVRENLESPPVADVATEIFMKRRMRALEVEARHSGHAVGVVAGECPAAVEPLECCANAITGALLPT